MPECFLILCTMFCRIDHVKIRLKEIRYFASFSKNRPFELVKNVKYKETPKNPSTPIDQQVSVKLIHNLINFSIILIFFPSFTNTNMF